MNPDGTPVKYTVPAIHYLPTDDCIMNSGTIAKFIEQTYPESGMAPWDPAKDELTELMRSSIGPVMQASLVPREIHILSPRAQEYFRRTREARLGVPIESLLEGDREDKAWATIDADLRAMAERLLVDRPGPFTRSDRPSRRDFFVAGSMESARIIDDGVFQRLHAYGGFGAVYDACLLWMNKRN